MKYRVSFRRLVPMPILCALSSVHAADLYVVPGGTAAGPGTLAHPYNLATAISGQVGKPGDTFWLRGGIHKIGHIDTKIHGAPGQPITFRQMAQSTCNKSHFRPPGIIT